MSTANTKPTHEQAQLHLQVFEMRREARLRQARDWFLANYFPESFDDAMKIAPMGTEQGTSVMMVFGYWEQACALLNHGLLHEDLFFEINGEFYAVYDRAKGTLEEGRKRFAYSLFLTHVEQAAKRYEKWIEARSPGHLATMRKYMTEMRQSQTAQAA